MRGGDEFEKYFAILECYHLRVINFSSTDMKGRSFQEMNEHSPLDIFLEGVCALK